MSLSTVESGIQPASEQEYLLKPTEPTQKLYSLEDSENIAILENAYKIHNNKNTKNWGKWCAQW